MQIDLTDQETQALVNLMDLALRHAGLQARPAVDMIWAKLEDAKRRSMQAPQPEPIKADG